MSLTLASWKPDYGSYASARKSEAVTYSGGTYVPSFPPTAVLVDVAGIIIGKLLDDSSDVSYPVTRGLNPLRFKSITESGTTATGLVMVTGAKI